MHTTPTILDCSRSRASVPTEMGRTSVLPFPCRNTLGPLGQLQARIRQIPADAGTALALVTFIAAGMALAVHL